MSESSAPARRVYPSWLVIPRAAVTPLVIVLGMLLMAVRRGGLFTDPKLWAEDGVIFWTDSRRFPLWTTIFHPYDGYLHVVPRILSAFTALFPIGLTPILFAALAIAVTALSCSLVLRREMEWLIPSYPVRVALFFALVILPGAGSEVSGTLTGIEEYLATGLLFLALSRDPERRGPRILLLPAVAVMGLTGPFAAVLAPAFWLRAWRNRSRYSLIMAGIVTGCAAIVAVGNSNSGALFGILHANWWVTVHNAVLGTFGSLVFGRTILVSLWSDPTLHIEIWMACLVLLALVAAACRDLPWTVALGLGIAMAGSIVSVIYRQEPGGWANLGGANLGNRYYALPVEIVIVVAGISLGKQLYDTSRLRSMLSATPVFLILLGCLLGGPLPTLQSVDWNRSVACLNTGQVCIVPIDPAGWHVYMSESPQQLQAACDKVLCSGENW
jgi:hypothetical protein